MSISSASVLKDGTVATTGGTATAFLSKGTSLVQHNALIDDGAIFALQSEVQFSIKEPKVSAAAPNGYTQARNTVYYKRPVVLDNGNSTVNTASITIANDPEMTAAEKLTDRVYLAQLLVDPDFTDFWDKQGLD